MLARITGTATTSRQGGPVRADPLSDVLRAVRLDGAFFYAVEASAPWTVEAVAAKELLPRILPGAEHLISYHILTAGHCWGGLIEEPPVALEPGDVLVFPHGDTHRMSSAPALRMRSTADGATPARYPETVTLGDGGRVTATFVCGFLGCDRRPFNPLLSTLPRRLHLRGFSNGWLQSFAHQVVEESGTRRAGADSVLTRLAELMFVEDCGATSRRCRRDSGAGSQASATMSLAAGSASFTGLPPIRGRSTSSPAAWPCRAPRSRIGSRPSSASHRCSISPSGECSSRRDAWRRATPS